MAHNRLNPTRALLKMRSTIAVPKTPCSGTEKLITLIGYSSVLPNIIWIQSIYIWVTISLTTISHLPIRLSISVFSVCGWPKIGGLWVNLSPAKKCVWKYQKVMCLRFVKELKLCDDYKYSIIKYRIWRRSKYNSSKWKYSDVSRNSLKMKNW